MLVVGDRGGGHLPGLSVGSVSNQVATRAKSTVAVVRGRPATATGPVVAAIGDDPDADLVLGWAFEEAALRGAEVLAVTARTGRDRSSHPTAEEALGTDLDSRLDPWRRKFPGVRARREIVAGRPERVLVQSCEQAQLVVVGPRRHGYQGVLLGAIGTRLLHRAACPVLVVRVAEH
jgi:nucleotide-binding universal stress UspA family protein